MTNYIKINEDFDYQKIKQLDIESEKKMVEGPGPADECICHLLADHAPQRGVGGTMRDSFKRAFRSMSGSVKKHHHGGMGGGGVVGVVPGWGPRERGTGSCVNPECDGSVGKGGGVYVPFTTVKGGKGIYTTKETLKRTKPCGSKCGCDKENIVMKHAYANIKIITPDVSSICPCPNSCIDSEALNSIKVTVEHLQLHPDTSDSEASVSSEPPCSLPEPVIEKRSISDLIDAQYAGTMYEDQEKKLVEQEEDTISEWSFGIPVGEEETEEEEDDEDEKQLPKKRAAKPMGSNHRSLCTVAATSETTKEIKYKQREMRKREREMNNLDKLFHSLQQSIKIEKLEVNDEITRINEKGGESYRDIRRDIKNYNRALLLKTETQRSKSLMSTRQKAVKGKSRTKTKHI